MSHGCPPHRLVPLSTCTGTARAKECRQAGAALNTALPTGQLASVGCNLKKATIKACLNVTPDNALDVKGLVEEDMSAGGACECVCLDAHLYRHKAA